MFPSHLVQRRFVDGGFAADVSLSYEVARRGGAWNRGERSRRGKRRWWI